LIFGIEFDLLIVILETIIKSSRETQAKEDKCGEDEKEKESRDAKEEKLTQKKK